MTDRKQHLACHFKISFQYLSPLFFYNFHDIIQYQVTKMNPQLLINCFFYDYGLSDSIGCRFPVSMYQTGNAQFDSAKITDNHH